MINYNMLAQTYAQNRQIHPEVFKNLLAGGALKADSLVLEVGCGTGNYISALQTVTGCIGWGLDPWPGMAAKARAQPARLNLMVGRAERLSMAGALFDLLFSVDVIHHVQDRPAYFHEAYRLLKPGGQICTVTDSEWIIQNRQPLSTYFPETVKPELERYPPIGHLREFMVRAGFDKIVEQTVETRGVLADIRPYQSKAFSALHLIADEAFQRGLARLRQDWQTGPIPYISRYVLLWGTK
jgi:ubiquinone/menaquinone biosynthesis C-methylase UbiE